MEFRITDTFTDSLASLTGEEQKAVKTTAFDLQLNPANPGLSFHKLDKAKEKNFWSVQVSRKSWIPAYRPASRLQKFLYSLLNCNGNIRHWSRLYRVRNYG